MNSNIYAVTYSYIRAKKLNVCKYVRINTSGNEIGKYLFCHRDDVTDALTHSKYVIIAFRPYFERSTSGYVVPSVIPDLPRGEHFTPLQVEALPKVVLQVSSVD